MNVTFSSGSGVINKNDEFLGGPGWVDPLETVVVEVVPQAFVDPFASNEPVTSVVDEVKIVSEIAKDEPFVEVTPPTVELSNNNTNEVASEPKPNKQKTPKPKQAKKD